MLFCKGQWPVHFNREKATYDKLLNEHSLSDTSTTEEANLAATSVRSEEIDDLDARDQDFGSS